MRYFLVYLFLEVMVTVKLSSYIGGFATFLEIILSALLGFVLLINMRLTVMQNLQALLKGEISPASFQRLNLWAFVGALLLILPGFLGDIIAICMQFGTLTTLFSGKVLHSEEQEHFTYTQPRRNDSDIIDVEIIEDKKSLKDER